MKHNIYVQDNFFKKDFFTQLQQEILTLEFKSRYGELLQNKEKASVYQRNYHHVIVEDNSPVFLESIKNIKKYFFYSVEKMESYYFLSFPNTPAIPHNDDNDFNCLIYLSGNPLMNNGTGFYIDQGKEKILNSHIGFKENRAVFFDAKIYHSPLQFAGNSSPRYVMANFIYKGKK